MTSNFWTCVHTYQLGGTTGNATALNAEICSLFGDEHEYKISSLNEAQKLNTFTFFTFILYVFRNVVLIFNETKVQKNHHSENIIGYVDVGDMNSMLKIV